ncbi:DNA translocase FtsK 4TM domain-containing protein [Isosphaeraceae bacterium EP7]
MLDRRQMGRHARQLAPLFATAFVALCLVGYNPADAPGSSTYPPNATPTNPCGPVGAAFASLIFRGVGYGAYVGLAGLVAANLLIFRRRPVPEIELRLAGVGLLTGVASCLVQRFTPWLTPTPSVGPGGYLGAIELAFLEGQFGPGGMFLILAAAGLAGLALCQDVLFAWPAQELAALLRPARREQPPVRTAGAGVDASIFVPGRVDSPDDNGEPGTRLAPPPPRPALARPQPNPRAASSALVDARSPQARSFQGAPESKHSAPFVPQNPDFILPPIALLEPPTPVAVGDHEAKLHARAVVLEQTLRDHGCEVRVVQIDTGPVITQFEIELVPGLRVARIVTLSNDLAIALAVPSVRIVAPIPNKTTVGIEVPNERRTMVRLGDVVHGVHTQLNKLKIPLFLGKDVKGNPLAFDLADMPHLLIAGRTGTGKSVCLNAMILSILMTKSPEEVKLILVDPKMVELSQFKRIPHLMHPVVTDMKKAESLLSWACDKMDERYAFLARAGVRNIQTYNSLGADEIYARVQPESDEERERLPTYMPYIVIIVDEMADLMMTAAKEVESHIVRLAQKARAVGMHLIVATQKPTVDVITGLIKGNMPARIAFQVTSKGDSRVVLDVMGADKLLGNGDMLFLIPGTSHIVRAQGTYVADDEITRVTEHLSQYPVEFSRELMKVGVGGVGGKDRGAALKERDEMYEPAIEVVISEGRGSTSLLQRALGIGYGRAARLIDFMAEDGIVGEFKSGSAREVLYSREQWDSMKGGDDGDDDRGQI